MRRPALTAAALLALLPTLAEAAQPPCLTSAEFASLADYAMPSLITGTGQRCGAALGPGSYLRRSGQQLAQRYAQRKPVAWPRAKAAFLKLSTTSNADANRMISTLPDASMQQMLDSLLEGMVSQRIPLDRCAVIDRLLGLLAPLPPENTAEVIAIAIGLGTQSGRANLGPISICPS